MAVTDVILSRLRGTFQSLFRIGPASSTVQVKRESSSIMGMRDDTDAAYVIVRAGDPVGDDDLVTKRYLDATGPAGSSEVVQFGVATAATTDSGTSLTANTTPLWAEVQITTAYSAGATIKVGKAGGTDDLLMLTTDINPFVTGIYRVDMMGVSWGAGAAAVRVTIAGAPAVGALTCQVGYVGSING